jgi:hypothetical protein
MAGQYMAGQLYGRALYGRAQHVWSRAVYARALHLRIRHGMEGVNVLGSGHVMVWQDGYGTMVNLGPA